MRLIIFILVALFCFNYYNKHKLQIHYFIQEKQAVLRGSMAAKNNNQTSTENSEVNKQPSDTSSNTDAQQNSKNLDDIINKLDQAETLYQRYKRIEQRVKDSIANLINHVIHRK